MTQSMSALSPALVQTGQPFRDVNRQHRLGAQGKTLRLGWVIGFVALHVLLGVLCKGSRWAATFHALSTLAVGLYLALTTRDLYRVACWGAYAVGAEVLWRLAGAPLPWEYAKYAVSLVLLISFLRGGPRSFVWTPVAYFLLLLPAAILSLTQMPLQEV